MSYCATLIRGMLLSLAVCGVSFTASASDKPNIVLILVDDLAFTDLGAYGSEIATPNIDALAQRGMLFSNYHASPMCAPSRAMLMTGLDSHQTGLANLPETIPDEHQGAPGYTGTLEPQATTIASRLQAQGYRTYMTGKWHLGHTPQSLPNARGFERSFILDATGGDNWEKRPYIPAYETADWFEDGVAVDLPEDFYSSEFLVDRMIDYIDTDSSAPFFSYVAFLAVHLPVQAPREFVDRYHGRYDTGWQALKADRHEAAVNKGVFPADAPIAPMLDHLRDWDALEADEQALLAARMEVYAGMVEAMDFHVGRLVKHLKDSGRYDNTIFIVTSDNGPEAADPFSASPATALWFWRVGYRTEGPKLGERGTWSFIGPEFASAVAGPLAYFKFQAGEGGVRVPMIMSGPGITTGQHGGFSFITDVVPTIMQLAGSNAQTVPGLPGRSLLPAVTGKASSTHDAGTETGFETAGQSGLYRGDYKLVRNWLPHGDKTWRLYNMASDPGETRDLAGSEPELFASMMQAYERYRAENGVLATGEDYDPVALITRRATAKTLKRDAPKLLLVIAVIATVTILLVRRRRRNSGA